MKRNRFFHSPRGAGEGGGFLSWKSGEGAPRKSLVKEGTPCYSAVGDLLAGCTCATSPELESAGSDGIWGRQGDRRPRLCPSCKFLILTCSRAGGTEELGDVKGYILSKTTLQIRASRYM